MSAALASIVTSLETAAGASTSANPNESGYWKRIAAAAEVLAGASITTNNHSLGYMKRTAVALESIAGTSGAEENANEPGYMKRIVDALEVQSGNVVTGSLMHRLKLGAQNALFSPYGPELVTNGDFATDSDWLLDQGDAPMSISGGKLRAGETENGGRAIQVLILSAHTYHVVYTIDSIDDGSVMVTLGDANGFARTAPGTYTEDIAVSTGSELAIITSPAAVGNAVIDDISVKQVL